MNDRKIERSDGRGFGQQQLLTDSMEISFPMKKKSAVTARYIQSIKTLLTVELSQVARFPQASPQRLPPTRKRPVFVLARPTRASRAGERPQELGR